MQNHEPLTLLSRYVFVPVKISSYSVDSSALRQNKSGPKSNNCSRGTDSQPKGGRYLVTFMENNYPMRAQMKFCHSTW